MKPGKAKPKNRIQYGLSIILSLYCLPKLRGKIIMLDTNPFESLKQDVRLLTLKLDALVKITEVICLQLSDKDGSFEKLLEKGCQSFLHGSD
jgi:hypothetical protein